MKKGFIALFPQYFDPTFSAAQKLIESNTQLAGQPIPEMDPALIVVAQTMG